MASTVKRLPFPDFLLTTNCNVVINQEGIGRNGEPLEGLNWNGKCIYSEKAERIIDSDGKKILLLGKVIVKGDIAPSLKNISDGKITINEATYEIYRGYRPRNPDGTIHHCEFELK